MKLVIQGKNIEITDSIREYVTQKIEKAVIHFQQMITEVDVHLSIAHNPRINSRQTAEVTIYANGSVVRAEEGSESLYASIDLVADKIARQLRKYKEKRSAKQHIVPKGIEELTEQSVVDQPNVDDLLKDRAPALPPEVIRTKYFAMPAMSVQEAMEHLEMVDHDFYVFRNEETGDINVMYERNHGGFGVIQPRNGNGHTHNGKHSNDKAAHPQSLSSV